MRTYPLRLHEFGISDALFAELDGFCRQYAYKQQELRALRSGIGVISFQNTAIRQSIKKPTEWRAMRAIQLQNDIDAIELSAKEASAELYDYLLRYVTATCTADKRQYIPCGVNQFRSARRAFYYLLAVRMEKIGGDGAIKTC